MKQMFEEILQSYITHEQRFLHEVVDRKKNENREESSKGNADIGQLELEVQFECLMGKGSRHGKLNVN